MKLILKRLLAWGSRSLIQGGMKVLEVGEGSQVYFWRIRSSANSSLQVGKSSKVESCIAFERIGASVKIGDRSFIGQGQISCASEIIIGDDVMVAWGASIFDHGSHSLRFSERANDVELWLSGNKDWNGIKISPTHIGDKAWIGYGAIILPGISVGEGAIIGAGSVVTKNVPAWTIVAGNPAKVIRELGEHER